MPKWLRWFYVCGTAHDAIIIEAPIERIEADVATLETYMKRASALVLDGADLKTEPEIVRYPERYRPADGAAMWEHVWRLLGMRP